jgi:hypothetical protein
MIRPDGDRGVEAMQVRGDHRLRFVAVAVAMVNNGSVYFQ